MCQQVACFLNTEREPGARARGVGRVVGRDARPVRERGAAGTDPAAAAGHAAAAPAAPGLSGPRPRPRTRFVALAPHAHREPQRVAHCRPLAALTHSHSIVYTHVVSLAALRLCVLQVTHLFFLVLLRRYSRFNLLVQNTLKPLSVSRAVQRSLMPSSSPLLFNTCSFKYLQPCNSYSSHSFVL